jgi:hypothetical protein
MNISIKNAEYIDNYQIKLYFNDDKITTIDFSDFLNNAKNQMTRKFLDKELFKNFTIINGDIIWNDYELCFPIWDLYNNNFN